MKFLGNVDVKAQALVETATASDINNSSATADFSTKGAYVFNVSGNVVINITNLGDGQRGTLSLYSGASVGTLSIPAVTKVVGSTPTLTANKLTVITIFNDGVNIISSFGVEV